MLEEVLASVPSSSRGATQPTLRQSLVETAFQHLFHRYGNRQPSRYDGGRNGSWSNFLSALTSRQLVDRLVQLATEDRWDRCSVLLRAACAYRPTLAHAFFGVLVPAVERLSPDTFDTPASYARAQSTTGMLASIFQHLAYKLTLDEECRLAPLRVLLASARGIVDPLDLCRHGLANATYSESGHIMEVERSIDEGMLEQRLGESWFDVVRIVGAEEMTTGELSSLCEAIELESLNRDVTVSVWCGPPFFACRAGSSPRVPEPGGERGVRRARDVRSSQLPV